MPLTSAVGMNTERSTSTSPTTGPCSSFMAFSAAWRGFSFPSSRRREQSSTTTMASSTTMATASTRPKRVSVLMENPSSFITAKVEMSDTGMESIGMMTARQLCRNSRITIMTISVVSSSVTSRSSMDSVTKSVELRRTRQCTPSGKYSERLSSSVSTPFATSSALAPGSWYMPISAACLPLTRATCE